MKTLKILGLLLIFSLAANADLTAVAVDTATLHGPNPAVGANYMGVVTYTLAPLTNDSVYVSITINPAAGGANLTLSEVKGDVGLIVPNTNLPNVARTYSIFFQASNAVPGTYYIAHITANANVTAMKTQVEGFLTSMTKAQKVVLFAGDGNMLGLASGSIPAIYMADGPHGIRGNGNATVFATCAGECSTWDTAAARAQGVAKGEEFRAYGRNCELGPADDLVYHPQGGRASEYYGEDPYLAGRMQAADVTGVQSVKCIATVKHFACNNKEQNRGTLSAIMNERSLRELYLYNWQPSFVRSQCWATMSAYNRLSTPTAIYASANQYILSTVLREEWGFKFLVMTDWGAGIDNCNQGMSWGADIDMPSPDTYTAACGNGQTDSVVNVHARRIILAHEMLGDLMGGYSRYLTPQANYLRTAAHDSLVRRNGAGGIVLAKNVGNILPLPKTGAVIAITGPFRNQCRRGPGGSSDVNNDAPHLISPLQGMRDVLTGIAGASTIQDNNTAGANYIVVFVGVTGETEGSDRPQLAVQAADGETDAATALGLQPNRTIVVFTGGSAATAGNWSNAPAVVIALYPGQEQGHSIADILFGNVNPSGKLPVTFPLNSSQLPNFALTGGNLIYPRGDTAHGYFRACKRGDTPLFWFGHGLSYTTFSYSNLQVYPSPIKAGDIVRVRVTVTNTGAVAGKEVVQLYLSMPQNNASFPTRVQDLRGFQKVLLNAGANTTVDFQLTPEEMRIYNPNGTDYANNGHNGVWTVLTGTYGVRVGTSADRTALPSVSGSFVVQ